MVNEDHVRLLNEVIFADLHRAVDHARENRRRFVHYTSAEAALSIISNKEVWLRNSSAMNDYSEIAYGENLFNGVLRGDSETSGLCRSTLNEVNDGLHDRIETFFNESAATRQYSTYLISVSEHGPYERKPGMIPNTGEEQYGRLSMWRAYGKDRVGVALVFNSDALLSESQAFEAYTSPVIYVDKWQFNHFISGLFHRIRRKIDDIHSLPPELFENNLKKYLHLLSLTLKHPGFQEEREWRVTYTANPDSEPLDNGEFNRDSRVKRDFVTLAGIPQRIYKIPFQNYPDEGFVGADIDQLLERIIIGPSQYPYQVGDAIIMALKKAGVHKPEARLSISNIPLRT